VHAGKLQGIEEALASLGGAPGAAAPASKPPAAPVRSGSSSSAASAVAGEIRSLTVAVQGTGLGREREGTAAAELNRDRKGADEPQSGSDLRSRIHAALVEAKQTHVADAIEHASVTESPNEIVFTAPKMYQMYLKGPDFEATVRRILGRTVKVTFKAGEADASTAPLASKTAATPQGDETKERALAHPEVKRFQEMFPDSQVRTVRNLRDNN
jgi:hypothetical protein